MRPLPFRRLALLVALAAPGACGGGDERGPGEPCTRDRDCADGLSCVAGVCVDPAPDGGDGAGP